jgi:hypothetical protein
MDQAVSGEWDVKNEIGGTGGGFYAIKSRHTVEEKGRIKLF